MVQSPVHTSAPCHHIEVRCLFLQQRRVRNDVDTTSDARANARAPLVPARCRGVHRPCNNHKVAPANQSCIHTKKYVQSSGQPHDGAQLSVCE
ncbi:hypothetical protein GDO78_021992 [Eleutherodactylus coqui]|uniref:Uncharacterized protein n=1 Tax=Eleutherodactylus coqui TaxID=57060 RepID=A0A8J6EC78_ELECQ|nr:hypothetical protein GDO78_021992 [Eleutherodactylus coqui]